VKLEILSRDSSARFELHQNSNRANAALFAAALNGCFRLLEQSEHLRVRTIRIPRAGDLATRTHVLAGSAQNRTNYGLAGREFTGRRRIISNSENDNLVLTTAKGKKQKRSPFLHVWIGVSRELDQSL
jgi:hypothetical protein